MVAFCFDRAIALIGQSIDNDFQQAHDGAKNEGEAKRRSALVTKKWFGIDSAKQQFAVPKATM